MTCTSCGDKPKGSSKGFPKAVVEINNPESLVLLRKVVIPVSMGTEEDVPPAIGKYFNVLLQYESNGHIYLYSSDGIPTAIEANIPQEVLDRIDQLEIDVDLLETGLANETTAREAADSALSSSINSLSSSLSAETAAREQADTTLQNNITAEATARANGDTNLQNQITQEAQARAAADTAINGAITAEASTRQTADAGLQSQIDAITASSDVKDIVGTKAELNNYDTSTLGNNDIIKVLQDESENDATTYYRWNATTQQFTLIGEEGPYYTKSQADTLLNAKQNTLTAGPNVQIVNDTISATDTTYTAGTGLALNGTQFSVDTTAIATQSDLTAGLANKQDTLTAGANIQINNNTISATDTTYSDFTGTDGTSAGVAGLVPAPATTDADKYLKSDGTWDTAGGGTSYTAGDGIDITNAVISATNTGKARVLTTADYNYPIDNPTVVSAYLLPAGMYAAPDNVKVSYSGTTWTLSSYEKKLFLVTETSSGDAKILTTFSIGNGSDVLQFYMLSSATSYTGLGTGLTTSHVKNNLTSTNTDLPLSANQGKVLKDLVDSLAIRGAGAPTTSTVGQVGTLYEDTTNGKLYICTDATNPYVWEEVGAGGGSGPTVVQTIGSSTTDVMSQNAASRMIYAKVGNDEQYAINIRGSSGADSSAGLGAVAVGSNTFARSDGSVALGFNALVYAAGSYSIAIGNTAKTEGHSRAVALGNAANAAFDNSVALGSNAKPTRAGEVNVGADTSGRGYNNTNYRVIGGVHDPQSDHDAATKGYVDTAVAGAGASAFTTNEWNALWA